jgi:hypothetical protein
MAETFIDILPGFRRIPNPEQYFLHMQSSRDLLPGNSPAATWPVLEAPRGRNRRRRREDNLGHGLGSVCALRPCWQLSFRLSRSPVALHRAPIGRVVLVYMGSA